MQCEYCKRSSNNDTTDRIEALRQLLMQWERYCRTLAEAGVIAYPLPLLDKTVGLLDATAC